MQLIKRLERNYSTVHFRSLLIRSIFESQIIETLYFDVRQSFYIFFLSNIIFKIQYYYFIHKNKFLNNIALYIFNENLFKFRLVNRKYLSYKYIWTINTYVRYKQATGIGGRGYFWYTPLAENFSKIPPLEILVIPVAWL